MSEQTRFNSVLNEELKYITVRRGRTVADDKTALSTEDKQQEIRETLVSLSLSGGGIRSAITCLGILQALAEMRLLECIDYLCTVSGGGYIGACLSALLSVRDMAQATNERPAWQFQNDECAQFDTGERFPFSESPETATESDASASSATTDKNPTQGPKRSEKKEKLSGKEEVKYLRTHGNFLIARRGIFGPEAMRSVGTLFTGVLLNIILFLVALLTVAGLYMCIITLLAPTIYDKLTPQATHQAKHRPTPDPEASKQTQTIRQEFPVTKDSLGGTTHETIETVKEPPTFLGNVLAYAEILWSERPTIWSPWPLSLAALAGVVAVLLRFSGVRKAVAARTKTLSLPKEGQSEEDAFESRMLRRAVWTAVGWTVGVTVALRVFIPLIIGQDYQLSWLFLPLVFCVVGLVTSACSLWIITAGSELWTRTFRSVWGSVQAVWLYLALVCVAFALLSTVVFALRGFGIGTGLGAVVAFVATRLLIRRTPLPARQIRILAGLRNFLLGVAVALLLVATFTVCCALLLPIGPHWGIFLGLSVVTFAVFVLVGFFVNTNQISLHYFYRDRLIETFLRTEVKNKDMRMQLMHDAMEIPLKDLHGVPTNPPLDAQSPAGLIWAQSRAPYHLISAAINMADRRDLTRKDRKSGYFLFSKLYCGSEETYFQRTDVYRGGETKLSEAMTISGAAVSSAMGYHTFFAQAFATALFNLRTGYWMENPRHPSSSRRRKIVFWPWYLGKEILSATSARDDDEMVNLSDGGHTGDNVGIYPLLRRRCKVIIACDAEQDSTLSFGSFTEALRHAYIDLNIDVDIDLEMLRPDATTGRSRRQCAIGRIRYPDRPAQKSWLIYLKSTLTGDEPDPVMNYKQDHPDFPHQSTGDQFFDDAQFESYRALGVYIAEHAFGGWKAPGPHASVQEHDKCWLDLQLRHSAFSARGDNVFQRLNDSYNALESMFMREPALRDYYAECYDVAATSTTPSADAVKIRQAFMMQVTLLEQVYFGLQLDRYANAPDVRGWMNLFRRWSHSPIFAHEFEVLRPLFSKRIVEFYDLCIKDRSNIGEDPVPHPWDSGKLKELTAGIFLDSGRVDPWERWRDGDGGTTAGVTAPVASDDRREKTGA